MTTAASVTDAPCDGMHQAVAVDAGPALLYHLTSTSSTVKFRVALGGMPPPFTPEVPYAI